MSTENIERNENRTQTESGKLNGVLCPSLQSHNNTVSCSCGSLRKCVSERDSIEPLQRDGDSLEQD